MKNIQDFLKPNFIYKGSERNSVLKEIYELYEQDGTNRRKENWKRYIKFLKENKMPDSKEAQSKFKKSRQYVKLLSAKSVAIILAPQNLQTLYYIRSVAKDKWNRGENVGSFILGAIKL